MDQAFCYEDYNQRFQKMEEDEWKSIQLIEQLVKEEEAIQLQRKRLLEQEQEQSENYIKYLQQQEEQRRIQEGEAEEKRQLQRIVFEEEQKQSQEENKKNEELIKKLQESSIKELDQRKNQEKEKEICEICTMELFEGDNMVIAIEQCSHIFHAQCLQQSISQEIQNNKFQLNCPSGECQSQLMFADYKYLLNEKQNEKLIKYSLEKYLEMNPQNNIRCPTPDCPFIFSFDAQLDNNNVICPNCKKNYCLKCKVLFHKDQTCMEYQISNRKDANDDKFDQWIKNNKCKKCPKCGLWAERISGCYKVTCNKCKQTFCYDCGGPTQNYYCPKDHPEGAK